jgi:hypothetical protein
MQVSCMLSMHSTAGLHPQSFCLYLVVFFLVVLKFECRASGLLGRCSTGSDTQPAFLYWVI